MNNIRGLQWYRDNKDTLEFIKRGIDHSGIVPLISMSNTALEAILEGNFSASTIPICLLSLDAYILPKYAKICPAFLFILELSKN